MFLQKQYDVLMQSIRHLYIKIDILNDNDITIDSLEGIAIDGSLNIDADSTYRRTGNLKLIINNSNIIPSPNSKIWFNKRFRIWVGLKNFYDDIVWFNYGKFAVDETSLSYNKTDRILTAELKDYMAFLDGSLGGNLSHEVKILPKDVTINEALKATLTTLGKISLDNIIVYGKEATLPYEITQQPNSTVYDLVKELLDLYMGYEFFYDTDGYFRVQKIKDTKYDPVLWDFTQNRMNLTINYDSKLNLKNIKNSVHIWGRQLDDGTKIYWKFRNRYTRNTVTDMINISDMEIGDICYIKEENKSYGYINSQWEILEFNVVPIFNIESIGEKVWVYNDDKLFTIEQAQLRGEYELWQHSNFSETISFNCIPIYMLDVNNKIKLNVPELGIDGDYLIKSISVPLNFSDLMQISASKIYY